MCNVTKEAPASAYSTDRVIVKAGTNLAAQLVAAADPGRRSITLINDQDRAVNVYLVGNAGGTITTGVLIKPGAGMVLNTTAAVYMVGDTTTDAYVYVITENGISR